MEKSLAEYVDTSLDRIIDITPGMRQILDYLYEVWNARDITVEEFKEQNGLSMDSGIYSIYECMFDYAFNLDEEKAQAIGMRK